MNDRFICPECDVVASRRHNFIRHLTTAHGLDSTDAEQLAREWLARLARPAARARLRPFVTPGHLRSVAMLEDREAAIQTIAAYRAALGGVEVLLRPVAAGLTVMSLDVERSGSMISVGAPDGGGVLTSLPPTADRIASMVRAYDRKQDNLARGSAEELFSLGLIAGALGDGLRLAGPPWLFVAHEWRVHLSNDSNGKIDLLGFDLSERRLVAIELKASTDHATKPDPNGWDAARQADEYADAIWRGRNELFPFFDRLIAAQSQIYRPGGEVPAIDSSTRPTTAVWWPDESGDHTPPCPAWNSVELAVASDSPRLAQYRRHQSWWRETQRGAAPAAHPKARHFCIGSSFAPDAVRHNRRLNFIDDAAYRHAEQRAIEVEAEGGTLDADRLFGNLLSSMPMCFNLFGSLTAVPRFIDVVRAVFDDEAGEIDRVICEAPSPLAWNDRTAFDAQIDYTTVSGDRCFIAVETKYTEAFTPTRYDRPEYREITERCGCFRSGAADLLIEVETNQLGRGLLLMSVVEDHLGAVGRYFVVAPAADSDARRAVETVCSWLTPAERGRLKFVSLEQIVEAANGLDDAQLRKWSSEFARRYIPPVRT